MSKCLRDMNKINAVACQTALSRAFKASPIHSSYPDVIAHPVYVVQWTIEYTGLVM